MSASNGCTNEASASAQDSAKDVPPPADSNGLDPAKAAELEREQSLREYIKTQLAANNLAEKNGNLNLSEAEIEENRAKAKRLLALKEAGIDPNTVTESEENVKEIKSIDSQLNRLNHVLDRIEKDNEKLNTKMKALLDEQGEARAVRKSSLQQREEDNKKQQEQFNEQMASIMARCKATRGDDGAGVL